MTLLYSLETFKMFFIRTDFKDTSWPYAIGPMRYTFHCVGVGFPWLCSLPPKEIQHNSTLHCHVGACYIRCISMCIVYSIVASAWIPESLNGDGICSSLELKQYHFGDIGSGLKIQSRDATWPQKQQSQVSVLLYFFKLVAINLELDCLVLMMFATIWSQNLFIWNLCAAFWNLLFLLLLVLWLLLLLLLLLLQCFAEFALKDRYSCGWLWCCNLLILWQACWVNKVGDGGLGWC